MTGYRGFKNKKEYEAYYSDSAKYVWEIEAMKLYAEEAEAEREQLEKLNQPLNRK